MPLQVIPGRDRELNALIKAATATTYRKGCVIYQQGAPSILVLLIQEGHVCLTLPKTGTERARVVGVIGPGELLGIEAITLAVPRRYTAIAGSACTVTPLNGAAVFEALRASPTTLSQFLRSNDHDLAGAHRSTVTTAINDWIDAGVLKPQLRGLIVQKPGTLRKAGTEASRKRSRKLTTR